MQNSSIGMTRDQYFEMCETLNTEPLEEEIPVELEDFPVEVHQAFAVYRLLRDDWDSFNGIYLGKSYIDLQESLYYTEVDLEDRRFVIQLVRQIDALRVSEINSKKANTKPAN